MIINIVNKHHGDVGEYIGRGSPLGNPFRMTDCQDRKAVIDAYRDYLEKAIQKNDAVIVGELFRLFDIAKERPLNLVCFCAPKPCHGDIIKEVLLRASRKDTA